MADSLNTNPIVVDLSIVTDRVITTFPVLVKHVLVSGAIALGPTNIALREGASGRDLFRFSDARLTANLQESFCNSFFADKGLFFENTSNRVFDADSFLLIYTA